MIDGCDHFSFVQITDCHLMDTPDSLLRGLCTHFTLQRVLQHIARHEADKVDFILGTGDYVCFPTDRQYACFADAIQLRCNAAFPGPQGLGFPGLEDMPIYFLPGNHDGNKPFINQLFPGSPVPDSLDFAFTHKSVRFICLDTLRYVLRDLPHPDTDPLRESSMRLLESECASLPDEMPVIVAMHLPAAPVDELPWADCEVPEDMERFWQLFARKNLLAILHGHIHTTKERVVNGVPVLSLRATANQWADGDDLIPTTQPPHYRVVTVADGRFSHRNVEVDTEWGNVDLTKGTPMNEQAFAQVGGSATKHLFYNEPPNREF